MPASKADIFFRSSKILEAGVLATIEMKAFATKPRGYLTPDPGKTVLENDCKGPLPGINQDTSLPDSSKTQILKKISGAHNQTPNMPIKADRCIADLGFIDINTTEISKVADPRHDVYVGGNLCHGSTDYLKVLSFLLFGHFNEVVCDHFLLLSGNFEVAFKTKM